MLMFLSWIWGRNSPDGMAIGYGLDDPGTIPVSAKFFSFPQRPYRLWGPSRILSMGREGDHLTSIKCRGQEKWSYTSTPPCLHGIVLT
jgi:hypothetical protein